MNNKCILIVEDDNWLRDGLGHFLQQANFHILTAADLFSARRLMQQHTNNPIDVVVCDIGLPDGSGLSLLEELQYSDTGAILISANSSEEARITGLKAGADDYVCKPINPDELLLRIKALLRRLQPAAEPSSNLAFLNYQLNLESRELYQGLNSCCLSINEHQLLILLIAQQGKIVSRQNIIKTLELNSSYIKGRALDILVSRLRNKIQFNEENSSPIVTYRGRGYMLIDRL